jgi:hypothetical protein
MRTEFVWKTEGKKPLKIPECKWDVMLKWISDKQCLSVGLNATGSTLHPFVLMNKATDLNYYYLFKLQMGFYPVAVVLQ